MGTRERRDRERGELKGRIMDAARTLFAAEGYAAVSMRRIAEAIEYSPTAIYFHFTDKDALIREICGDDFRRLAEACGALAAVADPVERLRQLGRVYVRFAVDHPNHYKLMFMTEPPAQSDGEPADPVAYHILLATVREGIAAGRYRSSGRADAQLVAQTVWAAVHGVASLQIAMGRDPCIAWAPLAARTAAAVDGILDGLLSDRKGAR